MPKSFALPENQSPEWYEIGSAKYPSKRDAILLPTPFEWLDVKQDADELEVDAQHPALWRIHNDLYDFTNFKNHPGGYAFIDFTKNTDITEMFESSHVDIDKAKAYLSKYFVKKATRPRNSRSLTFHPDGFYCTLRSRVLKYLKAKQVSTGSKWPYRKAYLESTDVVHDTLLAVFLALMASAAAYATPAPSMYLTLVFAGFILSLLIMCAHNYFHLRDNWRMFSFDLSMFSSHEWRISHGYSHHGFPNTMLDYEIATFEPILRFLPYANKRSPLSLLGTLFFVAVVIPLATHTMFFKRLVKGLLVSAAHRQTRGLRWENFLPVVLLAAVGAVHFVAVGRTGGLDASSTVALLRSVVAVAASRCAVMHISCSACFLYLSLAGTHHHPHVWHAGDVATVDPPASVAVDSSAAPPSKGFTRAEVVAQGLDWGTLQLLATGRRPSMDAQLWTAAVIFGQHALHHLFPTLDLSVLYDLEPIFFDTCREFNLLRLVDASPSKNVDRRSLSDWQCFSGTLYQAFLGDAGHSENFYPEVWNAYQRQTRRASNATATAAPSTGAAQARR